MESSNSSHLPEGKRRQCAIKSSHCKNSSIHFHQVSKCSSGCQGRLKFPGGRRQGWPSVASTCHLIETWMKDGPLNIINKTRPNWARKVRELILFNVLCTVYCGRGCLSLESEGKEMRGCVSLESGIFSADDGTTGRETRGVLRGPRGPKKLKPLIWAFIKNSIFGNNRDPCTVLKCRD